MTNVVVLDQISFEIDEVALFKRLRVRADRGEPVEVRRLLAEARDLDRPRALYKMAFVEAHGADSVVIDGASLTSRVLAVNLADVHRVFVFAATGGRELEAWQSGQTTCCKSTGPTRSLNWGCGRQWMPLTGTWSISTI